MSALLHLQHELRHNFPIAAAHPRTQDLDELRCRFVILDDLLGGEILQKRAVSELKYGLVVSIGPEVGEIPSASTAEVDEVSRRALSPEGIVPISPLA